MTREEWKEVLPFIKAYVKGQTVKEWSYDFKNYHDVGPSCDFGGHHYDYKIVIQEKECK